MKKYLITGVKSGLGKYLYDHLDDADGLHRDNKIEYTRRYDTVIHCAFNKTNEIGNYEEHYKYLNDNIFLTQELLKLSYSRFIYISSVDVYNKENLYSLFKKFAESIVIRSIAINYSTIILRCPMLIGDEMKENHLTKMFANNNQKISLSGKSEFNYILYNDIKDFILNTYNMIMAGIYDFVATENITLQKIKREFNLNVRFGDYIYEILDKFPTPFYVKRTSMETIKEYFK